MLFKKTLTLIAISSLFIGDPVLGQNLSMSRRNTSIYDFEGLQNKISLNLHLTDILDILKFISTKANVNIVTSKNVTGRVSLFISDVTMADALDIILLINNLAAEKRGDIIYIMSDTDYEALYGEKYYDKRIIETVQLHYAVPANIAVILQEIKSSIGKVLIDETTGTVVMIDTPKKIEQMLKVVDRTELPTMTRIYPTITKNFELQYANVENISKAVEKILTKDVGSVQYDIRTSRLIVSDLPFKMEEIENIVKAFDRKTRQIIMEAQILEVTLNDQFQAGMDWSYFLNSRDRPGLIDFVGKFPLTLTSYGQLTVGTIAEDEYKLTLQFLETLGKVNVLSTPQISVIEGEEAIFHVGTRQPYATSTTSQAQTTTTTSQEITFVDVGVRIRITPKINEDGFILLKLNPEVSTISGWYEAAVTSDTINKIPIVDTSTTETTVLTKDGSTVLLAGLIKDKETEVIKKIPFLGSIPVIGRLFSSKDNKIEKRELIILITPRIISGERTVDAVREKKKYRLPFRR